MIFLEVVKMRPQSYAKLSFGFSCSRVVRLDRANSPYQKQLEILVQIKLVCKVTIVGPLPSEMTSFSYG